MAAGAAPAYVMVGLVRANGIAQAVVIADEVLGVAG
jgi:hypothetical protein